MSAHVLSTAEVPPDPRTPLRMGLDIGSTTIKLVLLELGETHDRLHFQTYRRHHADVAGELATLFADVAAQFPRTTVIPAVTGSAGLSVAGRLGVPFVQEVVAGTEAVRRYAPTTDVIIELGGEDAKITYLHPVLEQRMNGSCAGGTGAFIDQMATLLHTDATGLDELAATATQLYPIASRCGVFAKSDLQPLLNEGASHADLAASIFTAVVNQTISGLACGRPIRGEVALLGGPLFFLPQLREAFARALDGKGHVTSPPRAQLYVALGAALSASGPPVELAEVICRSTEADQHADPTHRMPPLFAHRRDRDDFDARHRQHQVPRADLDLASGACFLGIDAGSTTIKAALVDEHGQLLFSHYASNEGDPVTGAVGILAAVHSQLPSAARIARTCVTGYGEGLVKAALRAEDGEIETMAHYRAASRLAPGVSSIVDIGGQDMKYLRVKDGAVDSICVNEACSSGCGSFLSSFATTMGLDVTDFSAVAMTAVAPVDLGSRCTVFMNSAVKQAQKEGAEVGEIAAGLSYSVVRNALYKVIALKDPQDLGDLVVVQGGTFLNDAVLRAFELLTGREVVRPDIAGLMGAYGAALIAQERYVDTALAGSMAPVGAGLLSVDELGSFAHRSSLSACRLCQNSCPLTTSTFTDGSSFVSGNRCDRGADPDPQRGRRRPRSALPNVMEQKYRRLFSYRRLTKEQATRGDIGIPRALNMYDNYPFWFTVLTSLGFRVVLSGRSDHALFEAGMDSIPSENVCYPAKLVHGHVEELVRRGVRTIFYPCIAYEQAQFQEADNHYNCPVVMSYPEVIGANLTSLQEHQVKLIAPFLSLADRELLVDRLWQIFGALDAGRDITRQEMAAAVAAGYAEDDAVRADIQEMGRSALAEAARRGVPGIVLAGRPYHCDPEIHHGIPDLITSLGMVVLTEDSIIDSEHPVLDRPLRVRDQWVYHSRLYEAAAVVAQRDDLELVQLTSFGCGIDAISADQVAQILARQGKVHTVLKIDEVSNLGAARIRLRSLQATLRERARHPRQVSSAVESPQPVLTEEMGSRHTLLLPQMSPIHWRLFEAVFRRSGYDVRLLEQASPQSTELGLKYVHNDACFPAIVVIGQLLDALGSGEFDVDNCSVLMSQTGGMCRATNYAGLLRQALVDAGYPQVPVVPLSAYGLEEVPGFTFTVPMVHRIIQAVVVGDLLQTCLLRTRPYELQPGAATRLYQLWDQVAREHFMDHGWSDTLGRRVGYRWMIDRIVKDFDALVLREEPRRPRVGVVGEILVKFHPDANDNVIGVVESQGCEAVLPGLLGFVLNSVATAQWNYRHYGVDPRARYVKRGVKLLLERYQLPAVRALRRTAGKFDVPAPIDELAEKASQVVSLGHQAGEGWYLVGEMIHLVESGVPNIMCVQPFACLPNHVTGKGMFAPLRRRYPQVNIVAVDYDPGASKVNQLNRITLMVSTAISRVAAPVVEEIPEEVDRPLQLASE
ncbi:hypothetical protein KEM60_01387 [Austwickia sp. TVS 96-490-7B]|uniref:acyl-CoA dehydratase activase-related protein n=1 Tax=Austwickia sp. TVS 96-490-7B TaxID=2830843 RepID=UPI001C5946B1|nr:acyl-CoA dehydratase activase-related protein [Austwickia sp. TVS 96-490-7B]MBW3085190.1 hypothetical protein [Austwickia sp. TVS 96-490-7B]